MLSGCIEVAREALAASPGDAEAGWPATAPVGVGVAVVGEPEAEDGVAEDEVDGELGLPAEGLPADGLVLPSGLEGEDGLEAEPGRPSPLGLLAAGPICWEEAGAPWSKPSETARFASRDGWDVPGCAGGGEGMDIPGEEMNSMLVTGACRGGVVFPGVIASGDLAGAGGGCHNLKTGTPEAAPATNPLFSPFVAATHSRIADSFSTASSLGFMRIVSNICCALSRFAFTDIFVWLTWRATKEYQAVAFSRWSSCERIDWMRS